MAPPTSAEGPTCRLEETQRNQPETAGMNAYCRRMSILDIPFMDECFRELACQILNFVGGPYDPTYGSIMAACRQLHSWYDCRFDEIVRANHNAAVSSSSESFS